MNLICEAPDDGQLMLHFLSPKLLGSPEDDPLFHGYADRAYDWVNKEHARYTEAGDEKLRRRYRRLLGYFHASGLRTTVQQRRLSCSRSILHAHDNALSDCCKRLFYLVEARPIPQSEDTIQLWHVPT